ncbi:MAG: hypothetical protein AAGJ18_00885 [Bacteroidota bacterium]
MTKEEKKELMAKATAIFGEQHLRVADLMVEYHKRPPVEPTKEDWKEWLEGLKEPMKSDFKNKSFETAKRTLSFSRYYQEKNDYGMRDFMRDNLSKEDFEYYMEFEKNRSK